MPVVELFELTVAPHGTYRYTSANQDITYGGEVYTQLAISRQQTEQKSDLATPSQVRVKLPIDSAFAQLFMGYPPQQDATATIRRGSYDFDTGITSVEPVVVDGLVTSTGSENGDAFFEIHPITEIVNRVGPRRLFSGACQNRLYGPGCRLTKSDFEDAGAIESADADTRLVQVLSSAERAAGYFVGGLYQQGTNDPLMIIAQPAPTEPTTGSFQYELTLSRWGSGDFTAGTSVVITPGCDYSRSTCIARFDNLENFGGFGKLSNVDRSPFLNGWSD